MLASFTTTSLKRRKGRFRPNRKKQDASSFSTFRGAAQYVSPSLPALEQECEMKALPHHASVTTSDQSLSSTSSSSSSSFSSQEAVDGISTRRHEKRRRTAPHHAPLTTSGESLSTSSSSSFSSQEVIDGSWHDKRRRTDTATARDEPSAATASMEGQCRPRRRRFQQQNNKWLFAVGHHADRRSHGKGRNSSNSSCSDDTHLHDEQQWTEDHFDVLHEVGSGTFGVVMLAEETTFKEHVALKRMSKKDLECKSSVEYLRNEVEIQTSIQHNHILECFGYFPTRHSITLVLEYGDLGTLSDYKEKFHKGKLALDVAACFMRQVASAVAYLDRHHVAHRDIKPENIVLVSDHSSEAQAMETNAKLCDFGYAVYAPPPNEDKRTTLCGTCEFCPPEMIVPALEREYVARYVDRWAMGVLSFELVVGKSPFYLRERNKCRIAHANGYDETHQAVFDRIEEFTALKRSADCDGDFYHFCSALMQRSPPRRLSASEALEHPWLCPTPDRNKPSRKRARTQYR